MRRKCLACSRRSHPYLFADLVGIPERLKSNIVLLSVARLFSLSMFKLSAERKKSEGCEISKNVRGTLRVSRGDVFYMQGHIRQDGVAN